MVPSVRAREVLAVLEELERELDREIKHTLITDPEDRRRRVIVETSGLALRPAAQTRSFSMAAHTIRFLVCVTCAPLAALAAASFAATGSARGPCEVLKITAPDAEPAGYLGEARMSSAVLVAASPAMGIEFGALYVFERATGARRFKLRPADADLGDGFGMAVAIQGRDALVGAPRKDLRGAAYLFDVREGKELFTLLPSDGLDLVSFGSSVAIDAQNVIVGAPGHYPFPPYAGAVYVFDRQSGDLRWRFAPLDLSNRPPYWAFFGTAVSAHRGRVLAGAPDDAQFGSAYVFDADSGTQLHKWFPPPGLIPRSFGVSVALHGDLAAIGDNEADGYRGAVHVFDVGSGAHLFTVQAPDGEAGDGFGTSVAVDERYLAVGSPRNEDQRFTGAVYLFRVDSAELVAKLHGFPARTTQRFGSSVDLCSGALAVADPLDNEAALYAGAAYVLPLAPCR